MNKFKYFPRILFMLGMALIISSGAFAQRGRGGSGGGFHNSGGGANRGGFHSYSGGGGFGRSYSYAPAQRFSSPRVYGSVGIGNRGYSGYNGYRPAYHYGGGYYNYYPRYTFHPFYRSPYAYGHFGPAFGFRLSILPFGYYPFFIGNDPFYYYNGIYYRPYAQGGYEVTAPPLGATVQHLPSGAKPTVINGQKYYELGGTFYQEEVTGDNRLQYVVVGTDGVVNTIDKTQPQQEGNTQNDAPDMAPQQGQPSAPVQQQNNKLSELPANSKAVIINQQKYYLSPSGVYYQEVIDENNSITYQQVGGDGNVN